MYYIVLQLKPNEKVPCGCVWSTRLDKAISKSHNISRKEFEKSLENDEHTILLKVNTKKNLKKLMKWWGQHIKNLKVPKKQRTENRLVKEAREFFAKSEAI